MLKTGIGNRLAVKSIKQIYRKCNIFLSGIMLLVMLTGCGAENDSSVPDALEPIPLGSESGSEEAAETDRNSGIDGAPGESQTNGTDGASGGDQMSGSGGTSGGSQPGESGQGQAGNANKDTGTTGADKSDASQTGNDPEANWEADFSFADLSGRYFDFSSGAGGWATELRIDSDGTFKGLYHDSEMGSTGDEYPNGTMYLCSFTGKFENLERIDEYTYQMKLASLEYEQEPDTEEIEDGILYIYAGAYGLTGGEEFYLYLPGARLAALPESYLQWVGYYNLDSVSETTLSCYGLYNVNTGDGFFSYAYEEQSLLERINMEISFAEESAAELEAKLEEATSQGDMNVISAELFQNWDDTLNIVWKLLEAELGESEMASLREEERAWIEEKEEQVKAAGLDFEGGTMQPMLEAVKAAEMTKERVYALAEYAK